MSHIHDDIRAAIADATDLMEADTWDECDATDTGGHSGMNSACNQPNNEFMLTAFCKFMLTAI